MLADSTALIDFLRGKQQAVNAITQAEKNNKRLYTTEVNVFELLTGIHFSKENTKDSIEQLNAFLPKFTVLQLDRKASHLAGQILRNLLKQGKRIQETDCLIAGIALANGVHDILTDNKDHFDRIPGIRVIGYSQ